MDHRRTTSADPLPIRDTGNDIDLSVTEHRYHLLLDEAPHAFIIQRQGIFLYANYAALNLFKAATFEDLALHGLNDLIHPDDRAQFITLMRDHASGEKFSACEIRCVPLDGVTVWMEATCAPVRYGGEPADEVMLRDITKRKKNEEKTAQQSMVMDGINRILHAALKYETEEELGRACLAIAEKITQSRVGFIGEIKDSGLEKIALVHSSDSSDSMMKATIPPAQHGGFHIKGLYGPVLTEGKGFFTNDPLHYSDSVHIPEGHPMLESFLGVPLIHEGETIGMIGLGNKPGGYTHLDQEFIEAVTPAIVETFMRQRLDTQMQLLYDQTRRDAITKTDLLNEINHRVKNNLMTILGLILAEKRHMPADQLELTEHVWEKFELRINGLLTVHQMLSDSQWTPMNMSDLTHHICAGVIDNYGMSESIALVVEPSSIDVTPRQANNLALVLNELMTNSLKYAFQQRETPIVTVTFRTEKDFICVEFRDNGRGYPSAVVENGKHHVGLRLVHQLVEGTLDGNVRLMNQGGAVAELRIRCEEHR
jgi:PAS domain S-box-containing protein